MPASTQAQQHPASRVASKRHAPWLVHRCVGAVSSCLQQAERFLALPTRLLRLRPLLLALATRCSVAVACGEKGRNALFLVTRSVPSVTGSRTARQPARRTTTNAHAASSPYLPVGGGWAGSVADPHPSGGTDQHGHGDSWRASEPVPAAHVGRKPDGLRPAGSNFL